MENQDIFNQFKKAADNAESPDFASMEKVWNRVEEKLDQKVLKKETILWKKWAVAASVLLGLSIGYQFLKKDEPTINSEKMVTQKDSLTPTVPKDAVVSAETVSPVIKEEANKILEKQITAQSQVAWADMSLNQSLAVEEVKGDSIAISIQPGYTQQPNASGSYENVKISTKGYQSKDIELFMNKEKQASESKKQEPLLVYDDLVSDKQTVKKIDGADIESIVILKEPLYIINGIYYTEKELFGPNPTSPYAPLNKQDIESISILQDEKAVAIYGEKGKKGVVIISTKNGKPAVKKNP